MGRIEGLVDRYSQSHDPVDRDDKFCEVDGASER